MQDEMYEKDTFSMHRIIISHQHIRAVINCHESQLRRKKMSRIYTTEKSINIAYLMFLKYEGINVTIHSYCMYTKLRFLYYLFGNKYILSLNMLN